MIHKQMMGDDRWLYTVTNRVGNKIIETYSIEEAERYENHVQWQTQLGQGSSRLLGAKLRSRPDFKQQIR